MFSGTATRPNMARIEVPNEPTAEIADQAMTRKATTEVTDHTPDVVNDSGSTSPELSGVVRSPGKTVLTASTTADRIWASEPSRDMKTVHPTVSAAVRESRTVRAIPEQRRPPLRAP